jgi:hypothetical protein
VFCLTDRERLGIMADVGVSLVFRNHPHRYHPRAHRSGDLHQFLNGAAPAGFMDNPLAKRAQVVTDD